MIQKMIVNLAIKAIAKQFKLDKVLDYVEKDNVLDRKVKKLEKKVKKLESDTLKFHTGTDLK
jgi:hypothetical protein